MSSPLHYLGGVIALQGCNKEPLTELAPKSVPATQAVAAQAAFTAPPTALQAAWQRFVDRVERGEQIDPAGQYVAKETPAAESRAGQRATRPKFDAATPEFARHYALRNSEIVGADSDGGPTTNLFPDPCEDCGGGSPPPTVTSIFASSVGRGGAGPIHDLKIIYNIPSQSATKIRDEAGYIMLAADLNKGANGAYIYFAFSRDVQQVLSGPEYYQNQPYSSPFDILRGFQTKNGSRFNIPYPSAEFFNIWTYYGGYTEADLNGGAGGEYIYSYQSKSPNLANSADITEVGVLSGNSDTIQPPAGWIKYGADLNEGCGGDYIYFCYKY